MSEYENQGLVELRNRLEKLERNTTRKPTLILPASFFVACLVAFYLVAANPLGVGATFWVRLFSGWICVFIVGVVIASAWALIDFAMKAIIEVLAVILVFFNFSYLYTAYHYMDQFRDFMENLLGVAVDGTTELTVAGILLLFVIDLVCGLLIWTWARVAGTDLGTG